MAASIRCELNGFISKPWDDPKMYSNQGFTFNVYCQCEPQLYRISGIGVHYVIDSCTNQIYPIYSSWNYQSSLQGGPTYQL